MTLKALTMPNYQWKAWDATELQAVKDLQPGALLVLLYRNEIPASKQKQEQLFQLVRDVPSIKHVLLRPYVPNIPLRDPVEWARECKRRAAPYEALPLTELVPANEWNIEGGGTDWERYRAWLVAFGREQWELQPGMPLHLPALSPQPGYLDGMRHLAYDDDLLFLYHVVDAHCYPGSLADFEKIRELWPDKPLDITEFNDVDPKAYMESLPSYVRAACWFILRGEQDQARYFLMGSPFYQAFKEYSHKEEEPEKGEEPDMNEPEQNEATDMVARTLLCDALKAFRQGKFRGADGIDGIIVALQGGQPLDFEPQWPPENASPLP